MERAKQGKRNQFRSCRFCSVDHQPPPRHHLCHSLVASVLFYTPPAPPPTPPVPHIFNTEDTHSIVRKLLLFCAHPICCVLRHETKPWFYLTALREHGRDWTTVAQLVGSKNESQCKNFYFNYKKKFALEGLIDEYRRKKVQHPKTVALWEVCGNASVFRSKFLLGTEYLTPASGTADLAGGCCH